VVRTLREIVDEGAHLGPAPEGASVP